MEEEMESHFITQNFDDREKYITVIVGKDETYGFSVYVYDVFDKVWFKDALGQEFLDEGESFTITSAIKKRSTTFIISDFISDHFVQPLKIAARKHDLIALRITDRREDELPPMGLVKFRDAESGQEHWVDTSNSSVRAHYKNWIEMKTQELNDLFSKNGIDQALVYTGEDYVRPLMKLFKKREARL